LGLFFCVFSNAQIYVSEGTQLFIGKDLHISGEINIIEKQEQKPEIYIAAGSSITGVNHLSNVNIIKIDDDNTDQKNIAEKKSSNKLKTKLTEQETKHEAKTVEINFRKDLIFQLPKSDDILYASPGTTSSFVPPHNQNIIWITPDLVGINTNQPETFIPFIFSISAISAAETLQLRVRPPPFS